tara:strand:- start:1510 stop:2271 length:762 start_codon:yes stop_codon:yes gene_type:complete
MNKPIEIVLNTIAATAADLNVVGGIVTIDDYSFPWKKMFSAEKQLSVAGTAGIITATPGALSSGTEYAFFLTQEVNGEVITERITWVSGSATPTAINVADGWRSVVLAHVNAGRFKITVPAAGAVTLILPASSVADYNLTSVSGPLGSTAQTAAPVSPVNLGADLLAAGVVDSFDSTQKPVSGKVYTSYELTLMLPKGSGGFNEQTSDQEHTLMLYLETTATNYAVLLADIDLLLNGEDAVTAGWDFHDALAV